MILASSTSSTAAAARPRAGPAAAAVPPRPSALGHRHHRRHRPSPLARAKTGNSGENDAPPPIVDPQAAQRQRDLDTQDDLLQHPDRCSWYEARFAGDGQPDWHPAVVVANEAACPAMRGGEAGAGGGSSNSSSFSRTTPTTTTTSGGSNSPLSWRLVTLAYEASRERVPLRNAYAEPGQTAQVRAGPAMAEEGGLAVANPPPYEGEVLLPPVPRRRPSVVAGAARRRLAAAEEAAAKAAAGGEGAAPSALLLDDSDDDDDDPSSATDDDPFDFDAPWRASPYYASGALPTPRETDRRLREALFRVRGDIFANEVKTVREPVSAVAPLQLLVSPKQAPELCACKPGDLVAVGPFQGRGLDFVRSGLLAVFRYRTLVVFVGGPDAAPSAVATARALLLSGAGGYPTSLLPAMRSGGVVVYYWSANGASVCFGQEDFDAWGSTTTMAYVEEEDGEGGEGGVAGGGGGGGGNNNNNNNNSSGRPTITRHRADVRVVTTTRGFADAFDGDDDLVFDPDETAAIVLTGGDAAAEAAALAVCREAEITAVVTDAPEGPRNPAPEYLSSIPKAFTKWAEQSREMRAAAAARDAAAAAAAAGAATAVDESKSKEGRGAGAASSSR
jgi:hypothetical protein